MCRSPSPARRRAIELDNGTLMNPLDHLKVKALPGEMPHEFVVDISSLTDMEAAIHVRDIVAGDKVTILNDPDELVARIVPPRTEEEPETVAAEEGEAAEGEGAEGEGEGTGAEESEAGESEQG